MQAVILAGGLGTRLRPLTHQVPKPMVEVGGRPFVEYIIHHLADQGFRRILMSVGYLGEQVESYFGDGTRCGVTIRYAREPRPLGTGGALRNALGMLDEEFLLLFGDSYLPIDYRALEASFHSVPALGLVVVYDDQGGDTGVLKNLALDGAGWVSRYEKGTGSPDLKYVEAGVLCFRREVFAGLPRKEVVSLEHEIYPRLIACRQFRAVITSQRFFDIGTPQRLRDFAAARS